MRTRTTSSGAGRPELPAGSPRSTRAVVALVLVLVLVAAVGCRRATREWRADDHDQEPAGPTQVAPAPASAGASGDEALVEATWRSACAACHGALGRGDGPSGPMVKAPDLTAKSLQESRTDEQLAAAIRGGRGKMPAFPQLPPAVVDGLVKRIRALAVP